MASGTLRPKRSQIQPEATVPTMFMAPMRPRAWAACISEKPCSVAWGTRWVSTRPLDVYPQTKKVAARSQTPGNPPPPRVDGGRAQGGPRREPGPAAPDRHEQPGEEVHLPQMADERGKHGAESEDERGEQHHAARSPGIREPADGRSDGAED